jgi:hypothetical protein
MILYKLKIRIIRIISKIADNVIIYNNPEIMIIIMMIMMIMVLCNDFDNDIVFMVDLVCVRF